MFIAAETDDATRLAPTLVNHPPIPWAISLAAACAVGPGARAEKADRSKPMSIEADQPGSVDLQRQVVIFNGNVVISQGTMLLRADRVIEPL